MGAAKYHTRFQSALKRVISKTRTDQGAMAQMAWQIALDWKVPGSNPAWCTEIMILSYGGIYQYDMADKVSDMNTLVDSL